MFTPLSSLWCAPAGVGNVLHTADVGTSKQKRYDRVLLIDTKAPPTARCASRMPHTMPGSEGEPCARRGESCRQWCARWLMDAPRVPETCWSSQRDGVNAVAPPWSPGCSALFAGLSSPRGYVCWDYGPCPQPTERTTAARARPGTRARAAGWRKARANAAGVASAVARHFSARTTLGLPRRLRRTADAGAGCLVKGRR